ncbi:hypothetical protein CHELA40_15463 [Chelatococcus asaccharovorans]|nr:hypothetical protein CHELA17_60153 [Chelatococcus asaccharovorans]CAH1682590.1 hypothetical protein CHELA40_15463 [Chelatococcus asaccharovorans]
MTGPIERPGPVFFQDWRGLREVCVSIAAENTRHRFRFTTGLPSGANALPRNTVSAPTKGGSRGNGQTLRVR